MTNNNAVSSQYRIYSIYSDRQAWVNSLDPDQWKRTAIFDNVPFATYPAVFSKINRWEN